MATFEFKLPDIGEGVVEGEIVKWLVKEGDRIKEDQPLVEVMTDKATVTIPSPKAGQVLKTFGKEGEIAQVHNVLVTLAIGGEGAPASAPSKPAIEAVPSKPAPVAASTSASKVLATPVTRRMAREHGLNLAQIEGTGAQGRVTKADVTAALEAPPRLSLARSGAVARAPAIAVEHDEHIPLKGLRKRIAEKMVRSKHSAAHFTFVEEMDATELVALRKRINEGLVAAGEDVKLSFLPFICKALVAALQKFPTLNANFDEQAQALIVRKSFNFGIAAATEEGLTVPVLKEVDRLSLKALGSEIGRLGNAARDRRLKVDELQGGTFTVTSLGQTGGLFATPIINHPEVAILGVHRMRKRPVVKDDQIVVREMMYLSLSFDHRVIDGSTGAEFTYELIRLLEHPELLFVDL